MEISRFILHFSPVAFAVSICYIHFASAGEPNTKPAFFVVKTPRWQM